MPTIDIKNWDNKKVGSVDLPEEIFAYPYKEHLVHEAVRNYLAVAAPGNAQDQDPLRSERLRQEAVPPEGHRPRASGRRPSADPPPRRHGLRSAARATTRTR